MRLSIILRAGAVALRRMRVPLYQSKYSRRDFTIHQHLLVCARRVGEVVVILGFLQTWWGESFKRNACL
jgi:hypothetical protein